jgi:hypothetical protein
MIDRIALAVLDKQPNASDVEVAKAWASAHWDLLRIKRIRRGVLPALIGGQASLTQLHLLLATIGTITAPEPSAVAPPPN